MLHQTYLNNATKGVGTLVIQKSHSREGTSASKGEIKWRVILIATYFSHKDSSYFLFVSLKRLQQQRNVLNNAMRNTAKKLDVVASNTSSCIIGSLGRVG